MKILNKKVKGKHHVINEDGEVVDEFITEEIKKIVVGSKETFFLLFAQAVDEMRELNGSQLKIMAFLAMHSRYNENIIVINGYVISQIEEKMGVKSSTVRKELTNLQKKDYLIRIAWGTYRINPSYYWKGDTGTRKKVMRLLLEFKETKTK